MRRSGTTILYDALLEDPELRCFYEPLREQKVSVGGGSGARDEDAFGETGALREEFRRERYPQLDIDEFNWGGPRKPRSRSTPACPSTRWSGCATCSALAPAVAIKETRFYSKVPELAQLDPDAALVHVVRDPRAVAASIVLGRGRRQEEMLRDARPLLRRPLRAQAVVVPADLAADDPQGPGRRRRARGAGGPVERPARAAGLEAHLRADAARRAASCSATATCWSATRTCASDPAAALALRLRRARPRGPRGSHGLGRRQRARARAGLRGR